MLMFTGFAGVLTFSVLYTCRKDYTPLKSRHIHWQQQIGRKAYRIQQVCIAVIACLATLWLLVLTLREFWLLIIR